MFVSTKVKVLTDSSGAGVDVPGLLTPVGVLAPLLDYCLAKYYVRSLEWMDKVVRSVQMFLEYMHANPQQRDSHLLFANFAQRLYSGTFDTKTGTDPSGLAWQPRSAADARHILTDLTLFFDWQGEQRPTAATINPKTPAHAYDQQWEAVAEQYRRDRSLLGHLWDQPSNQGVRAIRPRKEPLTYTSEQPEFPDDRFIELLTKGFRVGNRTDYRGVLITLLLHGAGFRESEPFHLYIEDVVEDPRHPGRALVRIHHPSEGFAPEGWKDALGRPRGDNRAAYLAERYGLVPRNQMLGTRHAGWKGGLHDGKYYKQAYWFRPDYGQLFWLVWKKYLRQVAGVPRAHPFAFINLQREPVGDMYAINHYLRAHAAACRRIGLKGEKALGTTPHGHRHSYGRRLARSGVAKFHIRRFMHHASEESQEVYTQATLDEMQQVLEGAQLRLGELPALRQAAVLLVGMDEAVADD
jgi:hypothetical protein